MKALYPKLEDLISESDNSSVLVYEICKSCEKRKLEIGGGKNEPSDQEKTVIIV